jgi:16S rRNA (cytosine967-C5)-methyltransferase
MAQDNKGTDGLIQLRKIAVKTLAQVANSHQSLEQSFFEEITRNTERTLPEFERAWIYELCSGVIRFRGRIDYIIDTYSLKKKPTGPLRRYLQTAVYQLLEQDTPSALVVSETVQAIGDGEGEAPSKFANAILRKVADSRDEWKNWKISAETPHAEQLAWSSLPDWLFFGLRKTRGLEWTLAFAKACLERPRTWYRKLDDAEPLLLEAGYRGDEPRGFVQDISNQLLLAEVVKYLKSAGRDPESIKILDLCSAPGGKSLGLAANGFTVVATDIDQERMQKVMENRSRLGFQKQIVIQSYKEIKNSPIQYDFIWIDAPCSSTGIIRRHPEVKWNRTEKEIEKLFATQSELVDWASKHLKEDGAILYSTCSVIAKENEPTLPAGLDCAQSWEWFPHVAPFGDAILAKLLKKASVN